MIEDERVNVEFSLWLGRVRRGLDRPGKPKLVERNVEQLSKQATIDRRRSLDDAALPSAYCHVIDMDLLAVLLGKVVDLIGYVLLSESARVAQVIQRDVRDWLASLGHVYLPVARQSGYAMSISMTSDA